MKIRLLDIALVAAYAPIVVQTFLSDNAFDDIQKLLTRLQILIDVHTRTNLPTRAKSALQNILKLFGGAKNDEDLKHNLVAFTRIVRLVLYKLARTGEDKTDLVGFVSGMALEAISAQKNWVEFITAGIKETSKL